MPVGSPSASPPVSAANAHPYAGHVAEAARRFGIPEAWIWSVMRVESAGDPAATSHAGAMGLMQVMPGTYAELRARYGLGPNPYDPRDSILAGAAYLREMHDRYGPTGMLAAYNAGPRRWEAYVAQGRPLPAETIGYLTRLAPITDSSDAPSPTIVAQVDRFAWRRASLFVALDSGAGDGDPNAPDRQPASAVTVSVQPQITPALDNAAPTPSAGSDALFAVKRPQ